MFILRGILETVGCLSLESWCLLSARPGCLDELESFPSFDVVLKHKL